VESSSIKEPLRADPPPQSANEIEDSLLRSLCYPVTVWILVIISVKMIKQNHFLVVYSPYIQFSIWTKLSWEFRPSLAKAFGGGI